MYIPLWLKIQRISLFLFMICGVLLLVYALGFISDVYLFYAYGSKTLVDFYEEMQGINTGLLLKAVLLIVFSVLLFMLELGRHPAGIITLILTALVVLAGIFFSANSLIVIAEIRQKYEALDLSSLNRYIERGTIQYRYSTLSYDLGLGGYALLLASSLFMAVVVIRNALAVKASPTETLIAKKDGA